MKLWSTCRNPCLGIVTWSCWYYVAAILRMPAFPTLTGQVLYLNMNIPRMPQSYFSRSALAGGLSSSIRACSVVVSLSRIAESLLKSVLVRTWLAVHSFSLMLYFVIQSFTPSKTSKTPYHCDPLGLGPSLAFDDWFHTVVAKNVQSFASCLSHAPQRTQKLLQEVRQFKSLN